MRTLDEILSELINNTIPEDLSKLLSTETWTKENRDERATQIDELVSHIESAGVSVVLDSITKNDNRLLRLKIKESSYYYLLEIFKNVRENLDVIDDLEGVEFDYEFTSEVIRKLIKELIKIQTEIQECLGVGEVEEL